MIIFRYNKVHMVYKVRGKEERYFFFSGKLFFLLMSTLAWGVREKYLLGDRNFLDITKENNSSKNLRFLDFNVDICPFKDTRSVFQSLGPQGQISPFKTLRLHWRNFDFLSPKSRVLEMQKKFRISKSEMLFLITSEDRGWYITKTIFSCKV